MFHVVGVIVRLAPAASAGRVVNPAKARASAVAAEMELKKRRRP
jgi:hypothetical protein